MVWCGLLWLLPLAGAPNCGVTSTAALCDVLGQPLVEADRQRLATSRPGPDASLDDVCKLLESVGVQAEGYRATAPELAAMAEPCIVHLQDPAHFAALAGLDAARAQFWDGWPGRLVVVPRADFERRYTGLCILPKRRAEAARADAARAVLAAPVRHHQFALGDAGATVEHVFTVENHGTAPLELRLASSSCSCTTTAKTLLTIAPGEQATVPVSLHLSPGRGALQYLQLATSDPLRPRLFLSVGVDDVPQNLTWMPLALSLRAPEAKPQTAILRVTGPPGFGVKALDCRPAVAKARLVNREVSDRAVTYQLEVESLPTLGVGRHEARLLLYADLGGQPAVVVPVTVDVPPAFLAEPSRLVELSLPVGPWHGSFDVVASEPDSPVTVDACDLRDLPLKATLKPAADGRSVHVELSGDLPRGIHRGAVVLTMASRLQRVFEVPVTLVVGDGLLP